MSSSEDLDALLGAGFTDEMMEEARDGVASDQIIRRESTEIVTVESMPDAIINDTADIVSKSNSALTAVLCDLQASPADPAIIAGAANLMNAHAQLLAQFNKTNTLYERMRHEKEMLAMKLTADKVMNDDAIKAKVMMTREQMFEDAKDKYIRDKRGGF